MVSEISQFYLSDGSDVVVRACTDEKDDCIVEVAAGGEDPDTGDQYKTSFELTTKEAAALAASILRYADKATIINLEKEEE